MIPTVDGSVEVYDPRFEGQKGVVDSEHIENLSFTERTGYRKDSGDLTISNDDRQYDGLISSGDALHFNVKFGGNFLDPWGSGRWDEGKWAQTRNVWAGQARKVTRTYNDQKREISIEMDDYVFSVLSNRNVTGVYENDSVREILIKEIGRNAPEIRPHIPKEIDETITITFDGDSLFDAIDDLLTHIGAKAHAWKDILVIRYNETKEPRFTAELEDLTVADVLETDQGLANEITLHGGTGYAESPFAVTDSAFFAIIHPDDHLRWQIETEKAEIAKVDVRLSATQEPGEGALNLRLQRDNDGPIDLQDERKDIASARLDHDQLINHYRGEEGEDLWVRFEFPEHTLPEPNPWAILEVEGEEPQRIVMNEDRDILHIPYYPYNIQASRTDVQSVQEFGRREKRVEAEHIDSTQEAQDKLFELIQRHSNTVKVLQAEAMTPRMHNLRAGELIHFDLPEMNTTGDYLVQERSDTFDGMYLKTDLTLEEQ